MQRTLDMVEERVRNVTRESLGRTSSDSQLTTDRPSAPVDADASFKAAPMPETRSSNLFDSAPSPLPARCCLLPACLLLLLPPLAAACRR